MENFAACKLFIRTYPVILYTLLILPRHQVCSSPCRGHRRGRVPLWKKNHPQAKTQVSPSAIIIQPSGIASVVEADIFCMSYREMAQLIGAEGLDAVHFKEDLESVLSKISTITGNLLRMD